MIKNYFEYFIDKQGHSAIRQVSKTIHCKKNHFEYFIGKQGHSAIRQVSKAIHFLLMPRKKQSANKRNENGSTNLAIDEEIVSDGRNSNGNTNLQCSFSLKSICVEEIQCR